MTPSSRAASARARPEASRSEPAPRARDAGRLWGRVLVRDSAFMYFSSISAGALQYGALILMARALGPGRLGIVVLATTIASMIAAGTELGVGPVLVRYRAELEEDKPQLWAALVHTMRRIITMVAYGLTGVALLAVLLGLAAPSSRGVMGVLRFAVAIAVPMSVMAFVTGYLQAERRFAAVAVLGFAVAALRLSLVATFALLHALTVDAALACYLVVAVAGGAAGWRMTIGRDRLARFGAEQLRVARGFALPYLRWSTLGRASAAVAVNLDVLLVSAIAGPRTTGIYGAAYQSATPIAMLTTAVGEVSLPHLVAGSRTRTTRQVLRRWVAWLPAAVALGLVAALLGGRILPLLLGARFRHSVAPFQVLVVAFALQVWLQPVGSLLYATNRQRVGALLTLLQTLVLLIAAIPLIATFGAVGPAMAILLATLATGPLEVAAALRNPRDRPESSGSRSQRPEATDRAGAR